MLLDEFCKTLMKPNVECVLIDNICNSTILSICSTYEEYT